MHCIPGTRYALSLNSRLLRLAHTAITMDQGRSEQGRLLLSEKEGVYV